MRRRRSKILDCQEPWGEDWGEDGYIRIARSDSTNTEVFAVLQWMHHSLLPKLKIINN